MTRGVAASRIIIALRVLGGLVPSTDLGLLGFGCRDLHLLHFLFLHIVVVLRGTYRKRHVLKKREETTGQESERETKRARGRTESERD